MKNLKNQTVAAIFFLMAFLHVDILFTQSVLELGYENIHEVVDYMEHHYGEQMEVTMDELYAYLENLLGQSELSPACETPDPKIMECQTSYISFDWDDIDEAEGYNVHYLDLYSGFSEELTIVESYLELNLSGKFYLFAFQSSCHATEKASNFAIIIVDKDILLAPSEAADCDCEELYGLSLYIDQYASNSILPTAGMAWQYTCDHVSKYRITVESTSTTPYHSEFVLVHDHGNTPQAAYLRDTCFVNFTATEVPYFAGDHGSYFVTMSFNGLILHFDDHDLADSVEVNVSVCQCGDQDRRSESTSDQRTTSYSSINLSSYPIPFQDELIVDYFLEQPGKIQLEVYNSLYRKVHLQEFYKSDAGLQRSIIRLPKKLPNGLYYLSIWANDKTEIIKTMKLGE